MNSLTEAKEFYELKKGEEHIQGTTLQDPHRQKLPQSICADTMVAAIP